MTIDRTTRVTAVSALVLASFALGVSLVSLGCERRADVTAEPRGEQASSTSTGQPGARPPAPALDDDPAPATVPTVQKVDPALAAVPVASTGGATTTPNASAATAKAGVAVKRLVVTHAIEGREPAKTAEFRAGQGPIVAFIEARNGQDESARIVVTFEHQSGKRVGFVKLDIPEHQSRWRTWARSTHVTQSGEWTAVVRDVDGVELARQSFEVQG
ncbi:MAG: DUF2914 domain-containing protein [Polyangiaceae bacterium]